MAGQTYSLARTSGETWSEKEQYDHFVMRTSQKWFPVREAKVFAVLSV